MNILSKKLPQITLRFPFNARFSTKMTVMKIETGVDGKQWGVKSKLISLASTLLQFYLKVAAGAAAIQYLEKESRYILHRWNSTSLNFISSTISARGKVALCYLVLSGSGRAAASVQYLEKEQCTFYRVRKQLGQILNQIQNWIFVKKSKIMYWVGFWVT